MVLLPSRAKHKVYTNKDVNHLCLYIYIFEIKSINLKYNNILY